MKIKSMVEDQGSEKTLLEEYGQFWWVTGIVIGKYLLGIIGGIFDGLVLFGIAYSATHSFIPSCIIAFILSVLIQMLMGSNVQYATKNIQLGSYKKTQGFGKMLIVTLFISFTMLGISLFMSWHTDRLITVIAKPSIKKEMKDDNKIKAYYDDIERQTSNLYKFDVTAIREEIQSLINDKALEGNRYVTKHAHAPTIKKLNAHLLSLKDSYDLKIASINQERKDALKNSDTFNAVVVSQGTSSMNLGIYVTRGVNIITNIIRCILVCGFTVFCVDARRNTKTPVSRSVSGSNRAPAIPYMDTDTQYKDENKDIVGQQNTVISDTGIENIVSGSGLSEAAHVIEKLKRRTRKQYNSSIKYLEESRDQQTEEKRNKKENLYAENWEKFQQGKSELEKLGISVYIDEIGKLHIK